MHNTESTSRIIYLRGKRLNFAWSSVDLHEICSSRNGLDIAAPSSAGDIRLLLTLLGRADDLGQVGRLNCATVEHSGASVVVRLGAIEIDATLVQLAGGPQHQAPELHARVGLMIEQIRVAGQPLLRAAG
ncbi:hypothetical protein [Microbacterium rhizosphaerae]|uniref:STAS domain-containing protein n=1 Tax=Microbacterium rhizosphaerae TaxID=1678237 RepID=A0ABZ0SLC5_9MICO|nr:hypothetical protein [Microbacterium rhizosphaerae]WPR90194.1 hypothetical protein SM116_02590 [Microbacterium rhizosphaerae]